MCLLQRLEIPIPKTLTILILLARRRFLCPLPHTHLLPEEGVADLSLTRLKHLHFAPTLRFTSTTLSTAARLLKGTDISPIYTNRDPYLFLLRLSKLRLRFLTSFRTRILTRILVLDSWLC